MLLALIWVGSGPTTNSQTGERPARLAVLDFGDSNLGRLASEKIASNLRRGTIVILDHEQVRAAARGAGYGGSINLSLDEARDLERWDVTFLFSEMPKLFVARRRQVPFTLNPTLRSLPSAREREGLSIGNAQVSRVQLRPSPSKRCSPN